MIIYKVSNSINEKSYIGKTVKSLQLRKLSHLKNLRLGHHSKLYDAMRKYGVDVFI